MFPKRTAGTLWAIGGGLSFLAGIRDLYLPNFLSVRIQGVSPSTAIFHFAVGAVLFLVAGALIARARKDR